MFKLDEIVEPDDVNIDNIKINEELNSDIFVDDKMKPQVRQKLLEIAKEFKDFCKIESRTPIVNVLMIGSNANYNYSNLSDIDLHLVLNFNDISEDKEFVSEFFLAKKWIWSEEYNITIKDYNVECYVQDVSEVPSSAGMYSVLNDNWLQKPLKTNIIIDRKKIKQKASEIINEIEKLEASKTPSTDKLNQLKEKIKKMRQNGLQAGGEYSIENLVFKVLRNGKYLEKIDNLKKKNVEKELSIAEEKEYQMTKEQLHKVVTELAKKKLK